MLDCKPCESSFESRGSHVFNQISVEVSPASDCMCVLTMVERRGWEWQRKIDLSCMNSQ